jgi:hypothetical protein
MMFSRLRITAVILACGLAAGCASSGPGAAGQHPQAQRTADGSGRFSVPLNVSNQMFPLAVGTQFVYQGTLAEGGESRQHSVVFTVTDLGKTVDGVQTVVALDQDFLEGTLREQELAFFAQDDKGNVWNFGEYPEEYDNGKFTGAPSTWIRGSAGAYGGIHMPGQPRLGMQYREGLVPAIQFDDVSRVSRTGQATCVKAGCYREVLVVDETSPDDPASGHQIKYYAPHTGLVRVGAQGGDTQEFLALAAVHHLDDPALAKIRAEALAMDQRAYRVTKVYQVTGPARRRLPGRRWRPPLRPRGRAGTRTRPAGRGLVFRSWPAGD